MKDGQCPMCKSNEVYANPKANFRAGGEFVDMNDYTYFTPYICVRCGFTAMYVEEMDELPDLVKEKGWVRVK
jgi:predicted nucleic-acid-binding Zn-ribbon protein